MCLYSVPARVPVPAPSTNHRTHASWAAAFISLTVSKLSLECPFTFLVITIVPPTLSLPKTTTSRSPMPSTQPATL